MAEVSCRRCGERKEGLAAAPIPGRFGAAVLAETCAGCWREWVEEQTRLINHERLQPAEPAHRQTLYRHMQEFLKLPTEQ